MIPLSKSICTTCLVFIRLTLYYHFKRRIKISFPADVKRTAVPDIATLAPGEEVQVPMEIVMSALSGAAKQVKVDVRCDQGAYVGIFSINDWDLMTAPSSMPSADFEATRDRLKGFRELSKEYPLDTFNLSGVEDIEMELIKRIRGELNMLLVQGAGLGELMLAAVLRKGFVEEKVLVTILSNE